MKVLDILEISVMSVHLVIVERDARRTALNGIAETRFDI
jgi:hypothetical protein